MAHWLEQAVLQAGLVTREQLASIGNWPAFHGASVAERLYRSGLVEDTALVALFVEQGAKDATPLLEDRAPPPAALGALSRALAARHHALPLSVDRSRVVVGMLDPSDTQALEEMAFYTGLSVEPHAVRASVLFPALSRAYGVPKIGVDVEFLTVHGPRYPRAVRTAADDDVDVDGTLPPPFADLPEVRVRPPAPRPADPTRSPLAAGIVRAAGEDIALSPTESGRFLVSHLRESLEREGLLQEPPPSTPALPVVEEPWASAAVPRIARDESAARALAGRDSLPPQVLRLLVPQFRAAVLFLVRKDVAVGWDGRAPALSREDFQGILLPLTGPSAFQRAWSWRMVAAGVAARPSTVERIFFRFLKMPPPSSFAVLPILVGDEPVALLYVDREVGALDDELLANARQVGAALADGLAPLVAAGTLFGA